jgi:hypothetical protein
LRSGPFGQGTAATMVKDKYVRARNFGDSEHCLCLCGLGDLSLVVWCRVRAQILVGAPYTCSWTPLCHASGRSLLAHRCGSTNFPRSVTHLYVQGCFVIHVLYCPAMQYIMFPTTSPFRHSSGPQSVALCTVASQTRQFHITRQLFSTDSHHSSFSLAKSHQKTPLHRTPVLSIISTSGF